MSALHVYSATRRSILQQDLAQYICNALMLTGCAASVELLRYFMQVKMGQNCSQHLPSPYQA